MLQHVNNFFSKKCVLTRLGHKECTAFVSHFLTFPRKQDTCKSNAAIESSGFPLGRHALKKKVWWDHATSKDSTARQNRTKCTWCPGGCWVLLVISLSWSSLPRTSSLIGVTNRFPLSYYSCHQHLWSISSTFWPSLVLIIEIILKWWRSVAFLTYRVVFLTGPPKKWLSVRLHVNPFKKVLSVRIS